MSKKDSTDTSTSPGCYYCGASATSRDHVPPKSFFPEDKDLPPDTRSLRQQLVTVPSCTEHNTGMSQDDEVAAYVVLMHHDSNNAAAVQFASKCIRALQRSTELIDRMFEGLTPGWMRDGDLFLPTAAVQIDAELMARVMERIARGLYFHEFGERWEAQLLVLSQGLLMPNLTVPSYERSLAGLSHHFDPLPKMGENPEVFWYQMLTTENGKLILKTCFYEGVRYYAFERPPASDAGE